ncbi:MAG: DUF4386 domain-containing protein [Bacteroidales bacterium]|nr:DUF4386 domain-containing protein [Bacteroidales bacterium]
MTDKPTSLKRISRIAGTGYLIIFITGIFSNFFVIEGLIVPGDPAKTTANIIVSDGLFRFGIFSFLVMVIFDLVLTWALYILLQPVNKNLSLFTAWFRLVNVAIFGMALVHLFAILQLTKDYGFLEITEQNWVNSQVMHSLNMFNDTWLIGLVFFGVHLLFLGYLIHRSGYIPKILGILLIIASIGYLADSFASFMLPDYADFENIFMIIVVITGIVGELSFTLWLLFNGVRDQMPVVDETAI